MVQTKAQLFDTKKRETAKLYKALSHPARIEILEFLSKQKSCYCGNISDEIPLSRTTVNQHLAELKKAGLIKSSEHGNKVYYCITSTARNTLEQSIKYLLTTIIQNTYSSC